MSQDLDPRPEPAAGLATATPFSNRAGEDDASTRAYVRSLLELLGDRDPLAVLAEMPAALATLVRGVDERRLRTPEAPGKWSVAEVIAHLADSEIVLGWRFRHMLADERPQITGYDQDAWARRFRYRDADLATSLALFETVRASNLRLLRGQSPADLERIGVHAERGPETVRQLLALVAGHDLVHRRQIARILAVVG